MHAYNVSMTEQAGGTRQQRAAQLRSAGAIGKKQLVWAELRSGEDFSLLLQELGLPSACGVTCHDVLSTEAWFCANCLGPLLLALRLCQFQMGVCQAPEQGEGCARGASWSSSSSMMRQLQRAVGASGSLQAHAPGRYATKWCPSGWDASEE